MGGGAGGGGAAKPKHSMSTENRTKGSAHGNSQRSAATVRRLKMYKQRPIRDKKGKILKQELQSKELPSTRIVPDRRWFGNTRVIGQKQLAEFRDEMAEKNGGRISGDFEAEETSSVVIGGPRERKIETSEVVEPNAVFERVWSEENEEEAKLANGRHNGDGANR